MRRPPLFCEKVKRRDLVQIYTDLLMTCLEPCKITRVLRLANIQFNSFREMAGQLVESGFLKVEEGAGSRVYIATAEGRAWVGQVHSVYSDLESAPGRGGGESS